MECNDILKVLNSILHGAELTSCGKDGTFWIDKWKKYSYQVNKAIANKIIDSNIVREDSGNFETRETHYVIDLEKYNNTKLERINELIKKLQPNELMDSLEELKSIQERKLKLLKLKERIKNGNI